MARLTYAIIYHHTFDRWTGMCKCGMGPMSTADWKAHWEGLPVDEQSTIVENITAIDLFGPPSEEK